MLKKIYLVLVFCLLSISSFAATRTIANGGGNWSTLGTWVEGAVPTSSDDVVATATSGSLTLDNSGTCKSIDFTNYVNTFDMGSKTLTVAGNFKLVSGMTFTPGTGTVYVTAASTITSAGKTFNVIKFGPYTYTLSENLTCASIDGYNITASSPAVINTSDIYITGNTVALAGLGFGGTGKIIFSGSGNQTWNGGAFVKNVTINKSGGTLTLQNKIYFGYSGSPTLYHQSGTVDEGTSTLQLQGTCTLDFTGGMELYNLEFYAYNKTVTLNSNITVNGTTSYVNSAATNTVNGNTMYMLGSITGYNSSTVMTGTTNLEVGGGNAQTWTGNGQVWKNNLTINKSGGTLLLSGTIGYNTGTLTRTAGTVDATTSNSALSIAAGCTLNTDGMSWNRISIAGSGSYTITLLSNFTSVGAVGYSGTAPTVTINGYVWNIQGDFSGSAIKFLGTTVFEFNGAANQSFSNGLTSTHTISNAIRINKTGGTLTLGTIQLLNTSIEHINGTVAPGTGTLILGGNNTLDCDGMTVNNVWMNYPTTGTTTLVSNLDCNYLYIAPGTLDQAGYQINVSGGWEKDASAIYTPNGGTVIFDGTASQTIVGNTTFYNLTLAASSNVSLTASQTFTVNNIFASDGRSGAITLNTTVGGTQAYLICNNISHVYKVTATDINSGLGAIVYDHQGAISNTVNWIVPMISKIKFGNIKIQ